MRRLIATLMLLAGTPSPAFATIEFCNKVSRPVHVALAYKTPDGWVSEGWVDIDPDKCSASDENWDVKSLYFYAESDPSADKTIRTWVGKGGNFAVKDGTFTFQHADQQQPGARSVPFSEVSIKSNDPSSLVSIEFNEHGITTILAPGKKSDTNTNANSSSNGEENRDGDFQTCAKASGPKAIAACGRAIASQQFSGSKLAELYYDRASARDDSGDPNGALADYGQCLQLEPNNANALNNRAFVYLEKPDNDRAIADLDQAIKLKPDFGYAYNNRGRAYLNKGDYDRAIADFTAAIKLKPDYAVAFNNRNLAYQAKGDLDNALKDLDEAIKVKPDYLIAYLNRGEVHAKQNEREAAIADYNKALSLTPDEATKKRIEAGLDALNSPSAAAPSTTATPTASPTATGTPASPPASAPKSEAVPSSAPTPASKSETTPEACAKAADDKAKAECEAALKKPDQTGIDAALQEVEGENEKIDRQQSEQESQEKAAAEKSASASGPVIDPDYQTCIAASEEGAAAACGRAIDSGKFKGGELAAIYFSRAHIHDRAGERDPAAADYNKVLELAFSEKLKDEARQGLQELAQNSPPIPNGEDHKACRSGTAEASIEACDKLISSGKFTGGDLAWAYVFRSAAHEKREETDLAIEDETHAIESAPNFAVALADRCGLLRDKQDFDRALQDCDKAVELAPDWAQPYSDRAAIYLAKGDRDHAASDYRKVLALNPDEDVAEPAREMLQSLATGTMPPENADFKACSDGDPAARLKACDQLVASGKFSGQDLAWAYLYRSYAHQAQNRFDLSADDDNRAIKAAPNFARAHSDRCYVLRQRKQPDRALKDCDEAIQLAPDWALPYLLRSRLSTDTADTAKAEEDLKKGLALDPERQWKDEFEQALAALDPDYQNCAKGSGDAAVAACDHAIASGRYTGRTAALIYSNRRYQHVNLKDLDRALDDANHAVDLSPEFADLLSDRCGVFWQRGEFDRALADCDQAIKMQPDYVFAYARRLDVKIATKDFDGAIQDGNEVVRLQPNLALSYVSRGNALNAKGDREGAAADYRKALNLNPNDELRGVVEAELARLGSSGAGQSGGPQQRPAPAIFMPDIHVLERPNVPAAPAAPEMPTLRVPKTGQVAFIVPLIPGWKTSHPDPASEMLLLTVPDRSIAISLDMVEDDAAATVLPADLAQKIFEHMHSSATPQPHMTLAGLQTDVFAGPVRNQKGADVNLRVLIAKVDQRHLAIVTINTLKEMTTQQQNRLNGMLNGVQIAR